MNRNSFTWIFVIAVVGIPVLLFSAVKWYENNYEKLPVLGGVDHRIEDFKMMNASGDPVTLKDWNNHIVVADFFFTHCTAICPKMTGNIKKVQAAFSGREDILFSSFSIDPERDSVQRLSAYAQKHKINQHNWHLLTGDKKEIYKLARNSFLVTATDGDGGPDDFIHSDKFVLVDRQKRIRGFYSGTENADMEKLIKDIKRLTNE